MTRAHVPVVLLVKDENRLRFGHKVGGKNLRAVIAQVDAPQGSLGYREFRAGA